MVENAQVMPAVTSLLQVLEHEDVQRIHGYTRVLDKATYCGAAPSPPLRFGRPLSNSKEPCFKVPGEQFFDAHKYKCTRMTHILPGRRWLWVDLRGMQLFASNPSSIVIHDRSGQHCHQLAEKTDTKMAGKYGGVEPLPLHSRSGYDPVYTCIV